MIGLVETRLKIDFLKTGKIESKRKNCLQNYKKTIVGIWRFNKWNL